MSVLRVILALAALAAALLVPPVAHAALTLPAGFEERVLASGLDQPTAVAWTPDGRMLVTEKAGRLRLVNARGALAPAPLLDLRKEVNAHADRGLLGVAVDPEFAANGYVYVVHTHEHAPADPAGPKTSRLLRLRLSGDAVVARKTLLGSVVGAGCPAPDNAVDCMPSEGLSHSIGTVRAAPDGTLWLGSGDASSFSKMDRLALRTADERSMAGKILHVDREGRGLPGHAFCPADADLSHVCTKVVAKGFRNPFRFVLRDGGALVGDVGWGLWEEIDVLRPGRSYGWPCYEASTRTPLYRDLPECRQRYAEEGTPQAAVMPIYEYGHPAGLGGAVQAGPQYRGDAWPAPYRGSWFVADYSQRWIRHYKLDAQGGRTGEVEPFATGYGGVDLEIGPTGDLVWVDIESGTVRQIAYSPDNATPVAFASATPSSGAAPLRVTLSALGSRDPDGDPLTYSWDPGDGSAPSPGAQLTHTYAANGSYTATVTVTDGRGGRAQRAVVVTVGNTPPRPVILAPADGGRYRDGAPVALRGEASDAEDGGLGSGSLRWRVVLRHGEHLHPVQDITGATAAFTPYSDHDADSGYVVTLTARDAGGLEASTSVTLSPETARVTLASDPPGAVLGYAGTALTAPRTFDAAIGFRTSISAPLEHETGGVVYAFDHWADGGDRLRDIEIPAAGATYTAVYRAVRVSGTGVPIPPPAGGVTGTGPLRGGPAALARLTLRRPWPSGRRAPVRTLSGRLAGTAERLRVLIAIGRPVRGSRTACQWWSPRLGHFGRRGRCDAPAYFAVRVSAKRRAGGWDWSAALRGRLRKGTYRTRFKTLRADGTPVPSRVVR